MSTRVIVKIRNGLVESVYSNRKDLEIDVIDLDEHNSSDTIDYNKSLEWEVEDNGYKEYKIY